MASSYQKYQDKEDYMNKDYNDYELVHLSQEHNTDAIYLLSNKYNPIIKTLTLKYFKAIKRGVELSDIEQECNLAFLEAIDNYNEYKNIKFNTFAISCMKNHLISIVRLYNREKHQTLNEALSLDEVLNNDNTITNYIIDETKNPENITLIEEEDNILYKKILKDLTPFEECVTLLRIQDYSYNEIATILDKSRKSIDSCIQRIKNKLRLNNLTP